MNLNLMKAVNRVHLVHREVGVLAQKNWNQVSATAVYVVAGYCIDENIGGDEFAPKDTQIKFDCVVIWWFGAFSKGCSTRPGNLRPFYNYVLFMKQKCAKVLLYFVEIE